MSLSSCLCHVCHSCYYIVGKTCATQQQQQLCHRAVTIL
jgi:hypothetical protein